MHRRWQLLAGVVGLFGLVGLAFFLRPDSQRDGVTQLNYQRITEGMSIEEAEVILGGPPQSNPQKGGELWWVGSKGTVYLRVTIESGKMIIIEKEFRPSGESFAKRIRRFFGGSSPTPSPTSSTIPGGEP